MITANFTAERLVLKVEGVDFACENLVFTEFGILRNVKMNCCYWDKQLIDDFKSAEVLSLGEKWYDSPKFKILNLKTVLFA